MSSIENQSAYFDLYFKEQSKTYTQLINERDSEEKRLADLVQDNYALQYSALNQVEVTATPQTNDNDKLI